MHKIREEEHSESPSSITSKPGKDCLVVRPGFGTCSVKNFLAKTTSVFGRNVVDSFRVGWFDSHALGLKFVG
jgi:hypothetical protein